jgi:hypothetical protein
MSDERDPKVAAHLAKRLKKIDKRFKLDPHAPFPISSVIARQHARDLVLGDVLFPIVVTGEYGSGVNAIVLRIKDAKHNIYALRYGDYDRSAVALQQELAKYAMAPRAHYAGNKFVIMDKISNTLDNYIRTAYDTKTLMGALKCLLDKKALLNMVHGDMHLGNIAILQDGTTLGFIDFEFSMFATPPPDMPLSALSILDFIPLLGDMLQQGDRTEALAHATLAYYHKTYKIVIHPQEIKRPKGGGFMYSKLTSYVADKRVYASAIGKKFSESAPDFALEQIHKDFPTLVMPTVVQ